MATWPEFAEEWPEQAALGRRIITKYRMAYLATVRPFPREALRAAVHGPDVVLVEPYLAGTSAAEISAALDDRPHRLLALGVPNAEFRHYGDASEHRAAHDLDPAGIRASLAGF